MWGGMWWGGLTYGGSTFTSFGLFNATTGLDACFDEAWGYAAAWYAGLVYAGTPICLGLLENVVTPTPRSNVRDLCIVKC